jgi:hypothetical protein
MFTLSNLRGGDTPVIVRTDKYKNYNYDPTVIYDSGIYRAYWCAAYGGDGFAGDHILYAESDALSGPWHAHGSSVANSYDDVLHGTGNLNDFDGLHTCDPTVIKVNGAYYMYYTGAHIPDAIGPGAIGVASSSDGIAWSRLNKGRAIVSPADKQAGDGYGAGEQTVTYVNGVWYMMYNDHTGAAAYATGAGEFLISASDPTFQTHLETFTANGFAPLTASTQTSYVVLNANNADIQYIDAWQDFLVLSHTDAGKTHVVLLDKNFNQIADEVIAPTAWLDGPGLVSTADQRHAIMTPDYRGVSIDFLRAVGAQNNVLTWKLAWRGANLYRNQ